MEQCKPLFDGMDEAMMEMGAGMGAALGLDDDVVRPRTSEDSSDSTTLVRV